MSSQNTDRKGHITLKLEQLMQGNKFFDYLLTKRQAMSQLTNKKIRSIPCIKIKKKEKRKVIL